MSAARSFDEVGALNSILIRTVVLRQLQQEIRGQFPTEDEASGAEEEPATHPRPSYRYGVRNTNPGQSRGRR